MDIFNKIFAWMIQGGISEFKKLMGGQRILRIQGIGDLNNYYISSVLIHFQIVKLN